MLAKLTLCSPSPAAMSLSFSNAVVGIELRPTASRQTNVCAQPLVDFGDVVLLWPADDVYRYKDDISSRLRLLL